MKINYVPGSEIDAEAALAAYQDRYTGDHVPEWAKDKPGSLTQVQYASDREWLDRVKFPVDADGNPLPHLPVIGVPTFPNREVKEKPKVEVQIDEAIASRM